MERFSALIGFFLILAIAYGLSNNKRAIRWKTVMWGLILQIATAVLVLKGELISSIFPHPGSQAVASAIFIATAIIVFLIAKRLPDNARRVLWYVFGVFAAVLFLAYNLLKYLFENLRDVVTKFIDYTHEGSKLVFGDVLGDPN